VQHRILLIENSITAESRMYRALSELGQVMRARSMLEATAQCAQLHPDMVVADCPVDGMACSSVAQYLKANDCDAALVALTYPDRDTSDRGNFAVLRKPVRDPDLLATARRILNSRGEA
jgi:CheY-like chemotaxis protein